METNSNLDLEKLLGNSIEEVSNLGKISKKSQTMYSFEPYNHVTFFGEKFVDVTISTDSNTKINYVSITFPMIIGKSFYDRMLEIYGAPNTISANDKVISETKSDNVGEDQFMQSLSKRVISMRGVSFEAQPNLILWNKENYQIKLMFYYEQSGTHLIFIKSKTTS